MAAVVPSSCCAAALLQPLLPPRLVEPPQLLHELLLAPPARSLPPAAAAAAEHESRREEVENRHVHRRGDGGTRNLRRAAGRVKTEAEGGKRAALSARAHARCGGRLARWRWRARGLARCKWAQRLPAVLAR